MFLSQEMHLLFSQVYRVQENHHLLLELFLLKHKEDISNLLHLMQDA
ncbi:putative excinuclease ABC subunit A2 UvrA [Acinetobacter baumannii 83444]|nr:putative excinuclease ABC subunit A2 UvrA [Acinetobacter baumannii 83444]